MYHLFQLCLLVLAAASVCAIPLADFYPFGDGTTDRVINKTLDGSSPPLFVRLIDSFPFFGRSINVLTVSIRLIESLRKFIKLHGFAGQQQWVHCSTARRL